jgi:hypothetical protein
MPRVEIETMIPALKRAKTVYALDRLATVINSELHCFMKMIGVDVTFVSRAMLTS